APAPAVLAVLPDLSEYDRPQEASSETKGLRSASTSEPGPPILRLRNAPKRGAWRLRWLLLLAACIGGMLIAQRYVGRPPTPPHSASGDTFATRHAPPPARTASATREVAAPR
ncbi:MAG: hypothetical protein VX431_00850, partial [Planctomycetota bacterium]|nr:hypothetical protein [Planctomycetota bacterium]